MRGEICRNQHRRPTPNLRLHQASKTRGCPRLLDGTRSAQVGKPFLTEGSFDRACNGDGWRQRRGLSMLAVWSNLHGGCFDLQSRYAVWTDLVEMNPRASATNEQ